MFDLLFALLRYLLSFLRARHDLAAENLALRHQLLVLTRPGPQPQLRLADRWLWLLLKAGWAHWKTALVAFRPETVIRWQRAGFRAFWRWKSRRRNGRPGAAPELVQLIRRMWTANPTWGSPRIRDELAKLGLAVSTSTIRKYRPHSGKRGSQSWWTFLRNHVAGLASMDFLVVPTVTGRLLYVLVVMSHVRRQIVHFHITAAPTAAWTAQPVVNAFPYDSAPQYLVRDRDAIYGAEFVRRVEGLGVHEKLISPHSPWQNSHASYCTSLVACGLNAVPLTRNGHFEPLCFFGGLGPGGSYRHSCLSL